MEFREIKPKLDEAKRRRAALFGEIKNLEAREVTEGPSDGLTERLANLNTGIQRVETEIAELQEEFGRQVLDNLRNGKHSIEEGVPPPVDTREASEPRSEAREAGLRAIERHKDALTPQAGDRLEKIVRQERFEFEARYLAAVGDPAYHSAFGKLVADPSMGHLRFTPQEVNAVQEVSRLDAERAMSTSGSAGGFAIPFTLDPSVMLSSNGVLNPVREVARVFTIPTKEWKGVSSDGVTASYVAEATEATDASPTLAQPSITTAQGRAFIPFSIEIGQDWGGIQEELLRLITDGRDVLDATQMLTGNGTNAPVGILAIGTTGALTTTQRVQTDVAATLDVDDVWDLKGNLTNTRFGANATFAGNSAMIDRIYRFTPSGSTTEPQAMPTRDGALCGRPVIEWSTMVNTTTTGSKVLILGDFSNYFIADRLGMTAELIPHLFGATNRYPTGQRGLYAYWRTGTVVAVPNAFRYLEVL
jgi:HK97 family phage major capsid protein